METKTVIIIGRSPFVTPELLERIKSTPYTKIAINQSLGWCDYIAHLDRADYVYGNAIPLTCIAFDNIQSPEKYNTTNKDDLIYNPNNHALRTCGFTHDFCVSWAIYKGYDKIIMAGAGDFFGTSHYDHPQLFNPKQDRINNSVKYLQSIPYLYTLNPNSAIGYNRVIELI